MGKRHENNGTQMINWEAIVVEGETAREITRLAAEQGIDLIVMYSRRIPPNVNLLKSKLKPSVARRHRILFLTILFG